MAAFASVDIAKGLNYRFQVNADNAITSGFLYWNPIHGDGRGSNGRLQNSNTDLMRWNTQNILNYNKTFFDNHNVSATTVIEYQKEAAATIREPVFTVKIVLLRRSSIQLLTQAYIA